MTRRGAAISNKTGREDDFPEIHVRAGKKRFLRRVKKRDF